MDCPRCEAELAVLENDRFACCPDCGGVWIDVAELNRILLRHNRPVLESMNGRTNLDEATGICPECDVDMLAVEGGPRWSLQYETCEVCGGLFVEPLEEPEEAPGPDPKAAVEMLLAFFQEFGQKSAPKGP